MSKEKLRIIELEEENKHLKFSNEEFYLDVNQLVKWLKKEHKPCTKIPCDICASIAIARPIQSIIRNDLREENKHLLSIIKSVKEPISGVCCACGDVGPEETECAKRDDKTHCNHWWDGTAEENPVENEAVR